MKVFFGSERCVLAFSRLGFVLKFPSLHRASWVWRPSFKDETLLWKLRRWLSQANFFVRRAIAQNRREMKVWGSLRDPFLAPTYFSLFGLMNVQAYSEASHGKELGKQLFTKIADVFSSNRDIVAIDMHSWFQIANYSVQTDGSLCKIDYGGENDLEVLKHFLQDLKRIKIP